MKAPFTCTKIITSLLSLGGLLAMAPAASAVVINPSADTFTSFDSQTTNYGTNINLNAENSGTGDNTKDRVTYIRFDLSSYTGGTVSGATLTMRPQDQISSTPQDFEIYGIIDGGADENFDETTLTWNTSGYGYGSGEGLSDSANFSDLDFLGTLTGVTPSDEGGEVDFSSAALDTFLNNDGNDIGSLIVYNINGTGSFNKFDSRQASSGGSTLTVVPEPTTTALAMALGAFAVVALVRRRRN